MLGVHDGPKKLVAAQFSYIAEYIRFPFVLILPQNITERVLGKHLEGLDVQVFRPYKVTDLKPNESDEKLIDVSFESGEVMQVCYVIGADGSRSIVRPLIASSSALCFISFSRFANFPELVLGILMGMNSIRISDK